MTASEAGSILERRMYVWSPHFWQGLQIGSSRRWTPFVESFGLCYSGDDFHRSLLDQFEWWNHLILAWPASTCLSTDSTTASSFACCMSANIWVSAGRDRVWAAGAESRSLNACGPQSPASPNAVLARARVEKWWKWWFCGVVVNNRITKISEIPCKHNQFSCPWLCLISNWWIVVWGHWTV